VLLSGGSAGGLSTFLHSDRVRSRLPGLKTFKVWPARVVAPRHRSSASHRIRYDIRDLAPQTVPDNPMRPRPHCKAAPVSGFFLDHAAWGSADADPSSYPARMRRVFAMQNCAGGVNAACVARQAPGEEASCMFAAASFAHSAVPTFVINSAIDSWQMGSVLKLTHGPHKSCIAPGYAVCIGVISDCHFRKTVTEYDRKPGIKRLSCTEK
jgi:hypothetical protein